MKKILNITSSAKGENSFSSKLSTAIVEKLQTQYPDSSLQTLDLGKNPLPHLDEVHLTAFFTPENLQTDDDKETIKVSNEAIKETMEADIIVISVPLYNFGIPSTLKSWIDHIARAGITFTYSENGPEGLIKNKKIYLAIASGGIYSEGPMKPFDFTEAYLRAVLGFLGMTDITVFRVEGTVIPEIKDTAVTKALGIVTEFVF
ncbi:FMN-dependent NADH-azoreductase [Flavobacterium sp. AED]|uniref:FMN-dependent NADH-azoreductase n=1 Tax=Flavobacterium sp. AED TaxID=1423323 RepID=UPI00058039BE|nr:FMN-dependent NADH-azoreductase [Flavobacterium sp. AED]KIA87700.1 FMN-dependent NADH-azoreductase [Flavobacterium sp. AED]MDI1307563.1 FMN-dependent NADH-azoreductase [bacterium]